MQATHAAVFDSYFRQVVGSTVRNDFAGLVEGGFFLCPSVQLVARYDLTQIDRRYKIANHSSYQDVGAGFNYFLGPDGDWGNHAKFSFDVDYLPNGFPSGGTGLDFVTASSDNEIAVRAQFQLWL